MPKFVLIGCLISITAGCGSWRDAVYQSRNNEQPFQLLKASPMSDDSVVLEISMINLPTGQTEKIDRLFQTLDLTRVDLQQRKFWDQNGVRIGVAGSSLPLEFDQVLASELEGDDEEVTSEETKMAPRRRIQARSGKPFRIATRPVEPELSWFVIRQDGYRQGGSQTFAQTEFEVRSLAEGDGSIRVILVPEILYGDPKQVVTTSNASLRYEMKRDAIRFSDLRLEAALQLGESLILAAKSSEAKKITDSKAGQKVTPNSFSAFGLGQVFFQGKNDEIKLVVIRLAQSQKDNLFDSTVDSQPLESITEQ